MKQHEVLAVYMPAGSNESVRDYTKEDLTDQKNVEQVFGYCKILHGYITGKGWEYLISHYGYERLYEINKKSGWLPDSSLDSFIKALEYERSIATPTDIDECGIVW